MTIETNEIKMKAQTIDGIDYVSSDTFAMAFLLDYDSVICTIDELIEQGKYDDMFIAQQTEVIDGIEYRGYLMTQQGAILLASEFGKIVESKPVEETILDKTLRLMEQSIELRIQAEITYREVKRQNEEMKRMFSSSSSSK